MDSRRWKLLAAGGASGGDRDPGRRHAHGSIATLRTRRRARRRARAGHRARPGGRPSCCAVTRSRAYRGRTRLRVAEPGPRAVRHRGPGALLPVQPGGRSAQPDRAAAHVHLRRRAPLAARARWRRPTPARPARCTAAWWRWSSTSCSARSNACLGLGAFTGTLTIRYERPTPIEPGARVRELGRPHRGPQGVHRRHHQRAVARSPRAPKACSSASSNRPRRLRERA